jgi:excinuclease UvrABC ATPase subunit
VIDLGPGAGHDGGRVIFEGPPAALARSEASLTGQHLRRRLEHAPLRA